MANEDKELLEKIKKADPEVMKKVEKILKDAAEAAEGGGMSPRAEAALKAVVRILTPFKEEIKPSMVTKLMTEAGLTEEQTETENEGEPGQGGPGVSKAKDCPPEGEKVAEKTKKAKNVDGDTDDEDDNNEEETMTTKAQVIKADGSLDLSAVPESVRPALELIFKGNQELVKKNADLETALKTERDQRREKEFVAKTEGFKHYVGDKAALAKELNALEAASKPLYDAFITNLEAVEKAAEANKKLFVETGSSRSASAGGSTWEQVEAAALAVVQKSGDSKVSKEQAVEQFLKTAEGQKMYGEYKKERGGI